MIETLPLGRPEAPNAARGRAGMIETLPLGRPVPAGHEAAVALAAPRPTSGISLLERDVVDALRIREMTVSLSEQPELDIEKVAERLMDGRAFAKKPDAGQTLPTASLRRAYDVTLQKATASLAARAVIRSSKLPTADVTALNGKPGTATVPSSQQLSEPPPIGRDLKTAAQPGDLKLLAYMEGREAISDRHFAEGLLLDESAPAKLETTIELNRPIHVSEIRGRTIMPTQSKADVAHEIVAENRLRIIDHVQELAALRGIGKATIRLHPEELGTITLTVRSFGTAVEANISASNESVRNALHAQRSDLVQSIESRGLSLSSFTVGQEAGNEAQANGQGEARPGHDMRQEFERASNLWSALTPATEPAVAASAASVPDGAVDYLA